LADVGLSRENILSCLVLKTKQPYLHHHKSSKWECGHYIIYIDKSLEFKFSMIQTSIGYSNPGKMMVATHQYIFRA